MDYGKLALKKLEEMSAWMEAMQSASSAPEPAVKNDDGEKNLPEAEIK